MRESGGVGMWRGWIWAGAACLCLVYSSLGVAQERSGGGGRQSRQSELEPLSKEVARQLEERSTIAEKLKLIADDEGVRSADRAGALTLLAQIGGWW